MKPETQRIRFQFDLSDKGVVDAIFNSKPPENVVISRPIVITKATADTGGAFVQITIQFVQDVHDLSIALLAAWLYDRFKQGEKKCNRINNKKIVLNKVNIRRLIKRELANQITREKQRRKYENRSPKKLR
jgi:hypothetical protein